MRDFYEGLLPGMKEARESLSRINSRFALIRLLLFAAFAGLTIAGVFRHYSIILFVLSFVSLAAFIVLCVIHGRSKHMEELLTEKIRAASRYLARIDGDYSLLTDEGAEFISNTHPFSSERISTGLLRRLKTIPSSFAWCTSSALEGSSASDLR